MTQKGAEAAEASEFLNADLHDSLPPPGISDASLDPEETEESGGAVHSILRRSAHPTVAIFHVLFKLAAITCYLLLGFVTDSFVVQFVVTVTLLAFDFWTVKNVTGRLLVGLRWWNEVGEDGTTQTWRFETVEDRDNLNITDRRIFWWTLYLSPAIWMLLGVVCVLKFRVSYLLIVVIALMLSTANIIGYYKCNKDATEQIRNYIGKAMLGHALQQTSMGSLSRFF